MKVKDLIDELCNYDQDAVVVIRSTTGSNNVPINWVYLEASKDGVFSDVVLE